jgi:plasmid stability protein
MTKTTLYLPVELQWALRDEAKRSGTSQAELVRDALTAFLVSRGRPRPSSIGIASDGSLAGRDSEDWLRETWVEHPD